MYVRLAFAVAAHLKTKILLVDEVLAVGDVAFQKKCLGKMENVAHSGRTVSATIWALLTRFASGRSILRMAELRGSVPLVRLCPSICRMPSILVWEVWTACDYLGKGRRCDWLMSGWSLVMARLWYLE